MRCTKTTLFCHVNERETAVGWLSYTQDQWCANMNGNVIIGRDYNFAHIFNHLCTVRMGCRHSYYMSVYLCAYVSVSMIWLIKVVSKLRFRQFQCISFLAIVHHISTTRLISWQPGNHAKMAEGYYTWHEGRWITILYWLILQSWYLLVIFTLRVSIILLKKWSTIG